MGGQNEVSRSALSVWERAWRTGSISRLCFPPYEAGASGLPPRPVSATVKQAPKGTCARVSREAHTHSFGKPPHWRAFPRPRGVVPGARTLSGLGESFQVACDLRVGILAAPGQVRSPSPSFPQTQSGTAVRLGGWRGRGRAACKVASHAESLRVYDFGILIYLLSAVSSVLSSPSRLNGSHK